MFILRISTAEVLRICEVNDSRANNTTACGATFAAHTGQRSWLGARAAAVATSNPARPVAKAAPAAVPVQLTHAHATTSST